MHSTELQLGRTFLLAFEDGDDFLPVLTAFCRDNNIRQGYIPMFLGGFRTAEVVGTLDPVEDTEAPVWATQHLSVLEAHGCGTLAWDEEADRLVPHLHLSVGRRDGGARGYTSHLVAAEVQFIQEMVLVEVQGSPAMLRPCLGPHRIPTLTLGPAD